MGIETGNSEGKKVKIERRLTKRCERGRICMGNKKYVGQGESKMRIEGVKEQDEKLLAVILDDKRSQSKGDVEVMKTKAMRGRELLEAAVMLSTSDRLSVFHSSSD
ncbi:hypothetical protein NQZ68_013901 [Dissostichus eleginoides]|nr:hypothetical protein NQZ68_013901 [Dissostichus eleginoides]